MESLTIKDRWGDEIAFRAGVTVDSILATCGECPCKRNYGIVIPIQDAARLRDWLTGVLESKKE